MFVLTQAEAIADRVEAFLHEGPHRLGRAVGGILCLQLLLGLGNIVFQFPVWVATAHNAVGAVLLMSVVTVNYFLMTARNKATANIAVAQGGRLSAGVAT